MVVTGLVLVALAAAGMLLVPRLLGYDTYVVTGGSMAGTIDKGALVYERRVPASSLRVGDVITYQPPAGAQVKRELVTHRIHRVSTDRRGRRVFVTKGDANAVADPWTFTLDQPRQARYAFQVPFAGWVYDALSLPWVRVLLLAVPALLIGLALLRDAWRDAGEEASQRR
jgi:signal peptidase